MPKYGAKVDLIEVLLNANIIKKSKMKKFADQAIKFYERGHLILEGTIKRPKIVIKRDRMFGKRQLSEKDHTEVIELQEDGYYSHYTPNIIQIRAGIRDDKIEEAVAHETFHYIGHFYHLDAESIVYARNYNPYYSIYNTSRLSEILAKFVLTVAFDEAYTYLYTNSYLISRDKKIRDLESFREIANKGGFLPDFEACIQKREDIVNFIQNKNNNLLKANNITSITGYNIDIRLFSETEKSLVVLLTDTLIVFTMDMFNNNIEKAIQFLYQLRIKMVDDFYLVFNNV